MGSSKVEVIYSLLCWTIQVYFSFAACRRILAWLEDKEHAQNLNWINFLLVFSHVPTVPLYFWKDTSLLVDYLEMWDRFKVDYEKTMKIPLRFKSAKRLRLTAGIAALGSGIFMLSGRGLMLGLSITDSLLVVYPIVLTFSVNNVFWSATLHEIRVIARQLADRITQYETRGEEAGQLRLLWHQLVQITGSMTDSMGIAIIAFGTTNFINLIFSIFSIIGTLVAQYHLDGAFYIIILVSLTLLLTWLHLLEKLHVTSQEIGNNFAEALLKINITSRHPLYIREVKLILMSIEMNPPKTNILGFFTADRHLILVFFKSVMTYLIILLQSIPASRSAVRVETIPQ